MTRTEMAKLAQDAVNTMTLPPGARAVVVVTDEAGAFVGVGRNTTDHDTMAILACALYGADRVDHVRRGTP